MDRAACGTEAVQIRGDPTANRKGAAKPSLIVLWQIGCHIHIPGSVVSVVGDLLGHHRRRRLCFTHTDYRPGAEAPWTRSSRTCCQRNGGVGPSTRRRKLDPDNQRPSAGPQRIAAAGHSHCYADRRRGGNPKGSGESRLASCCPCTTAGAKLPKIQCDQN